MVGLLPRQIAKRKAGVFVLKLSNVLDVDLLRKMYESSL